MMKHEIDINYEIMHKKIYKMNGMQLIYTRFSVSY